jgi:hypothetical protein
MWYIERDFYPPLLWFFFGGGTMQPRESRGIPAHRRTLESIVFSLVIFMLLAGQADALVIKIESATIEAWNRYYQWANARVQQQIENSEKFLIQDNLPAAEKAQVQTALRNGEVVVKRVTSGVVPAGENFKVPDGTILHVWGSVFLPKIKMPELMRFLQDYDHHAGKFKDVERSRLVSRDGDNFKIYYRLSRSKAFVTAYYNSDQDVVYRTLSSKRIYSKSIATKIAELENPGSPEEKERPVGNDRGFLWRLVSWWRFQETDSGVIVECESASLSRGIPEIVNWIPGLGSYIRNTPIESLRSVITSLQANYLPAK